jgi:hypothetical protein
MLLLLNSWTEKDDRTMLGEEGPGKYHVLLTANDAK